MNSDQETMTQRGQRQSSVAEGGHSLPRRSLRWLEVLEAPIHDFPIRDEILHQYAPLLPGLKVLEVGPGTGFTAYTLLPKLEQLTLVDFAEETLTDLRQVLGSYRTIRYVQADICKPGLAARLGDTYEFVFGLDMFECVPDGDRGLENLASVISRTGVLFLTFPNFAPPRGEGLTWYAHRVDLEKSLERAGFRRWEIYSVSLKPYASAVYRLMHEWPLRFHRQFRKTGESDTPQTYEGTWAFQNRKRLRKIKPFIHLYWMLMSSLLRLGGDPFKSEPVQEEILSKQLVVIGWK